MIGIPENKRETVRAMYLDCKSYAEILAVVNAMPGPSITGRQIKQYIIKGCKIKRPPEYVKNPSTVWTVERMGILRDGMASGVSARDILARVNAASGPTVTIKAMGTHARSSGIKRPSGYVPPKRPCKPKPVKDKGPRKHTGGSPGIPQNKRETVREMYMAGALPADIIAAANDLPGTPIKWTQIRHFARETGLSGLVDRAHTSMVWTADREAIVAKHYPTSLRVDAVLGLVNALPGRPVSALALKIRAMKLGVSRPARIHVVIGRALSIPSGDARAAMNWAEKRGVSLDGSPMTIAARIADAMRIAA